MDESDADRTGEGKISGTERGYAGKKRGVPRLRIGETLRTYVGTYRPWHAVRSKESGPGFGIVFTLYVDGIGPDRFYVHVCLTVCLRKGQEFGFFYLGERRLKKNAKEKKKKKNDDDDKKDNDAEGGKEKMGKDDDERKVEEKRTKDDSE